MLFDLLAVAYQADLTRVATFMMAREASMKTYPDIGITDAASHDLAPWREAGRHQEHATLNTYHVSLFAKLVEKLRAHA